MAQSAANAIDLVTCDTDAYTRAAKNYSNAARRRQHLLANQSRYVRVVDSIRRVNANINDRDIILHLDVIT
jgi:hypothetical protein